MKISIITSKEPITVTRFAFTFVWPILLILSSHPLRCINKVAYQTAPNVCYGLWNGQGCCGCFCGLLSTQLGYQLCLLGLPTLPTLCPPPYMQHLWYCRVCSKNQQIQLAIILHKNLVAKHIDKFSKLVIKSKII